MRRPPVETLYQEQVFEVNTWRQPRIVYSGTLVKRLQKVRSLARGAEMVP